MCWTGGNDGRSGAIKRLGWKDGASGKNDDMKIPIAGSGYVGLVTAAGLCEMGNHVLCTDVSQERVDSLQRGKIPFFEPGLAELVARNVRGRRLSFASHIEGTYTWVRLVRLSRPNYLLHGAIGLGAAGAGVGVYSAVKFEEAPRDVRITGGGGFAVRIAVCILELGWRLRVTVQRRPWTLVTETQPNWPGATSRAGRRMWPLATVRSR